MYENNYTDDIIAGKVLMKFDESEVCDKYVILQQTENAILIKSLKLNNFLYKPGILLNLNSKFLEIAHILKQSDTYYFLCDTTYIIDRLDEFCNSLVIKEIASDLKVLNISELKMKTSFEKVFVNMEIHVICNSQNSIKI